MPVGLTPFSTPQTAIAQAAPLQPSFEGGFSEYITSQGTVSAANCGVIAKRIVELGANHPMTTFAADLNARVTAIDEGQTNYDNALRARKMAEADDELAQAALSLRATAGSDERDDCVAYRAHTA